MAESFGGVYRCPKGHETGMWFFDSKPEARECPRCDNGTMAKLERVKDYAAGGRAAAKKKREQG